MITELLYIVIYNINMAALTIFTITHAWRDEYEQIHVRFRLFTTKITQIY
jgi:hypothetical protein